MARLGKLVKTLKIGIGTATDFLKSKGFTVEEDFNSKLTGEQEALLLKEFATPEMMAEFDAQKKDAKKAKVEESKKAATEPKKEQKKSAEPAKPQLNVVGKIDLDALNKPKAVEKKEEPKVEPMREEPKKEVAPVQPEPKKEEKKVEVKPKKEEKPKESKPVEKENLAKENKTEKPAVKVGPKDTKDTKIETQDKKVEETKKTVEPSKEQPIIEKKEEEIFTFRKVEFKSDIKVLDKIDLSAINSNTRPAKKSKEELRKDRIAKERQAAEARRKAQKEANKKHYKRVVTNQIKIMAKIEVMKKAIRKNVNVLAVVSVLM